jgi:hypothetical protein
MFHVVTMNLDIDLASADVAHGPIDLGQLTAEEFAALLERFRQLDPVQVSEADPHLLVTARAGKFRVRTVHGKLILETQRSATAGFAEFSAGEIIRHLDRSPATAPPFATDRPAPEKSAAAPNRGIAAAILAAGLALNGYTLYSVFYTETVNEKPAITLLTDPAEITAHLNDVVGTFATGDQPGDRTITVVASGRITFAELGARPGYNDNTDTFRLGRMGKTYGLNTVDSGVVEVVNLDTLRYYRDTYTRTK